MIPNRPTMALVLSLAGICTVSFGLVTTTEHGHWSLQWWPVELERYRAQARSVFVGTGIQENVHEIPFHTREDFEEAWPHILKLRSNGSRLIIEKGPSTFFKSTVLAGVRVLCPSGGISETPDGNRLMAGPPWPEGLKARSGELPEYVVHKGGEWVPFDGTDRVGFRHRARVDIVLVADGEIVDLNRIPLPPDTLIVDKRFQESM